MGFQNDQYLAYTNIAANATTLVRTGSGRLGRIVVNGGTLTGDITVYDGVDATGTVIATIDGNQAVGNNFEYNCTFVTGLTIVTSASVNITVVSDKGQAGEA